MSTIAVTNVKHPSAANPAIVLDAAGNATVAGMGLVLVSPTSIANSGGSASASGGQVTFTGVSSVSLNGVFTSAYRNYFVILTGLVVTGSPLLQARLSASGTPNTTSNYAEQYINADGTAVVAARRVTQTSMAIGQLQTTACLVTATLSNPAENVVTTGLSSSQGRVTTPDMTNWAYAHDVASVFDGLVLFPATSTMTGTIRVYGYKNS